MKKLIQRYNTIRVRFAIWVGALLLAMLLIFAVFIYVSMANALANAIDDSLQLSAVQAIAAAVDNGRISVSDGVPAPSAITDLDDRGFTIRLIGLDGTILGAFGLYRDFPLVDNLWSHIDEQENFTTLIDPNSQEPVRFYTAPIIINNRTTAVIQVAQSLDTMNDTLEHLVTLLFVIVPLLVALAVIGAYVLVARVLSPIDAITRTAQRISEHDLHERLNLPETHDEVGRLATTFDIMLARLESAFKRERQFTTDASHELRTPLTAMQTIIAVTREKTRSVEDYKQVLDDFSSVTTRLKHLVEDLLHLAREDQNSQLVRDRLNLSTLLQDVCDVIQPLVEAKNLHLSFHIVENLYISADSDKLIQVFMNVLDNAVKYTYTGSIRLDVKQLADTIEVVISDTGVGIPEQDLPHIFDRFYRVDTLRSIGGNGLGLSIAQTIIHAHKGEVKIESQVGRGTKVTIHFLV